MKVEVKTLWSLHAGAYQVWYIVRADDHKMPGVADLASRSYYLDSIPVRPHATVTMVGHCPADPSDRTLDTYWKVTPTGKLKPTEA